ncbi:hypothetical protein [Streptomyces sp. NPDC006477]|uniref:hypothetical protein n=1 Tax=Streptomyces sp. NPDC006477 TaxID=3364747 RepID=UPI00368B5D88
MRLGEPARRAAAALGGEVEVRIREDEVVETDARRVERILANLVTKTHRHGAPPVLLEVDGAAVRVSDHGPGFPDGLLAEGPRRVRTGRGSGARDWASA